MVPSRLLRQASLPTALLLTALLAGCLGDDVPDDRTEAVVEPSGEGPIQVDITAIPCPEGYDNRHDDNVCLAYNGQIPGPTWVFGQGERVQIELTNKVAAGLAEMDVDPDLAKRLGEARYTMHRHGIAQDACSDGVAQPAGTFVCDSAVGPEETVTYTFDTLFPGFWHYHDHGHTFTAEPAHGPLVGHQGSQRGLWGSFLVLEEGASTDHVFDLHLIDTGTNGGLGLDGQATEGDRFDLLVTSLTEWDWFWEVTLNDPDGNVVDDVLVGPGVSRGITVQDARSGTYTWSAELVQPYETYRSTLDGVFDERPDAQEGTIEVLGAAGGDEEASSASDATSDPKTSRQRPLAGPPQDADRTFTISFDFYTTQVDGLPLLEAYAGELLEFQVLRGDVFGHTFHMHGHTWEDPDTGDFIDTVPLVPGIKDEHSFTVVAGLGEGHSGDWLYHCHIGADAHMWGLLRVYPHTMTVEGPLDELTVTLTDEDGRPVEGTSLSLRLEAEAPTGRVPSADGPSVPAEVQEPAPGVYVVRPDAMDAGHLVVESDHPSGTSLARLEVAPDGSYGLMRGVGTQQDDIATQPDGMEAQQVGVRDLV